MFAVQNTTELKRVHALPRRTWTDEDAAALSASLTAVLRTPAGTMALRPIQGVALFEADACGGLFAPMRVGAGKTLLSLLLPFVLNANRPMLLIPAKLKQKTIREYAALRHQWCVPNHIRIETYELLGRVQAAEMLASYRPDLIVCDEAHRIKNSKAAVTRRVLRYLRDVPECRLVAMSGTITKRSLRDYAHLLLRCLGPEHAPVTRHQRELEEWADALDERPRVDADARIDPGALLALCTPEELKEGLDGVRRAFGRRLVQSPGVVATREGQLGCSLSIASIVPKPDNHLTAALRHLRDTWELPDGTPFSEGLRVFQAARQIALGFYYKWDPPAPIPWLEARRAWYSECRRILTTNRRDLDSELQVTNAVDAGLYPEALEHLERWRGIKASFEPNPVPVWLSDNAIDAAIKWAALGPGIVWTEHTAFAERLAERSGLTYYGPRGKDTRTGRAIEDADPRQSLIASVASNAEGRNLQAWCRNLVVSPPSSGSTWEQLIGRTHRDGQEADEVTVDVVIACDEHRQAMTQAMADARYIEAQTQQAQKLTYADVDI